MISVQDVRGLSESLRIGNCDGGEKIEQTILCALFVKVERIAIRRFLAGKGARSG